MYHYSYPGSLQIIATQRNYALWFPDMFFSAWSGSKWLWPHDVKSKPSKIHCDLQKALGPQGTQQPGAQGEIAALTPSAEAGAPSGFHLMLSLSSFPCLGSPEPCTGCCEPSSSCLWWGRRKIAQGGDMGFLSSHSQYSWHPQQHITLLFNGVGKNIFTIFTSSEGFHIGLSCFMDHLQ